MSLTVLIANLPPGTTEQEVRELLENSSIIQAVEIKDDGDPERLTAAVEMDLDRTTAKIMKEKGRGMRFKDRALEVYVPTLF
ncbi:MAG: RNA-binding protein [gamma proteobacterium symbiont of Bathyaustriella thionipta]|nr:RNA-binding protein [gamma proteobacterium symbiont of Bathyaustriella thionipta]